MAVNTHVYHTVQLKSSVWVFMYLSVHILCMNDCTLPIHLNSNLHITSTLIWAIKCAVCLCTHSFLDCHRQVCQSVCDLHPCFLRTTQWNLFAEKTFPKRRSAFCNDCNRWKCFTTHFHSFVVINKIALNCIRLYFQLLSIPIFKKEPRVTLNSSLFHTAVCLVWRSV